MKNLRITILVLILIFGFCIPYVYSVIQGNYAVSVVDPANSIKYYTVPGDATNGMYVNVKTGTVAVTQSTQANLNATVYQSTGTNLHAVLDTGSTTACTQATAANLNATVSQTTGATFTTIDSSNTSTNINTNLTGAVKDTSGYIMSMVTNTAGSTSDISFYNVVGASCTGVPANFVFKLPTTTIGIVTVNHQFSSGICAITAGGSAAGISVLYR